MSDTRRIRRGFAASFASIGTRVAVQFATMPIFFASWSPEQVGTWFVIFAVPAYIALVGNAFSGAGGTAALAAATSGDLDAARADFRTSWSISAVATAALGLLFATASMFLMPTLLGERSGIDVWDLAQAAAWLALYIFASSQMAVFEIPYRVAGKYPDYIFAYNAASLLEIVVIAAAVTFSQSFAILAMCLALFRCLSAVVIFAMARKLSPDLFARSTLSSDQRLAALWKPSLAFMLMPLVYGLNLQGYLLLVGATFGTFVLAGFAATRVLTRILDLGTNFSFAMQFYESGYLASDRRAIQRRMLATISLVTLALAVCFSLALMMLGPWIQRLYTMGETYFEPAVALVLLLAAGIRALAATPFVVLAAENRHPPVISIYLAGSAAALVLAVILGLIGAPLWLLLTPLVIAELSQLIPAMRSALALLDLTPREFFASLAAPERVEDLRAMWQKLVSRK